MSAPRVAAYLPLLCGDSGDASTTDQLDAEATIAASAASLVHQVQPHTMAFSALTEASVCLQCASPLNTLCGFSNCALTFTPTPGGEPKWHWEMAQCECEACETACGSTAGESSAIVRDRLLERHRFRKLDAALGVDDSIDVMAARRANAVPVLCLRRAEVFTPYDTPLRAFIDSDRFAPTDVREYIFCSFDRTALFVGSTQRGKALFFERVEMRTEELANRYQIVVPRQLIEQPRRHSYGRALFVRVVVAYDALHLLRTELAFRDQSCASDAHLLALALQLFADTHLDLQVFCDVIGNWNDDYLSTPTISSLVLTEWGATLHDSDNAAARAHFDRSLISDCVLLAPIERYYPHPLRAPYGGELLDLNATLAHANIWSQVDSESRTRATAFAHVFLRKAVDHKCPAVFFAVIFTN